MNLDKVKEKVETLVGKEVSVKVNIGRNKYEHFIGTIICMYPSHFTIKVDNLIKSFSYSDVLTKDVQLKVN